MIIFKKKHRFEKKIYYGGAIKALYRFKVPEERSKAKNKMRYFKHIRQLYKVFYIKDIFFYPECIWGNKTLVLEFVLVNRIFKKSLLNG